jgi:hypothetical protein
MLKSELQGWFESHPAISIRQFAIECGYSDGGRFRKYMRTPAIAGELVSNTILKKIEVQLKHYGFIQIP